MNENIKIRIATEQDIEQLLEIYSYYVLKTAISFEYEVPSHQEFAARMAKIKSKYPYLVAEENGVILGYAYANTFIARTAYDHTVEATIYLNNSHKGKGVGRALYQKLEELLAKQNVFNVTACIATCDVEDEYLTNGSKKFHGKMGYNLVGEFIKCGYKFERWYNMIWMEKHIVIHPEKPQDFIPFTGEEI